MSIKRLPDRQSVASGTFHFLKAIFPCKGIMQDEKCRDQEIVCPDLSLPEE
jgi:hypothetical protein